MSALIEFDHVCKYYQMGDTLVKAADHISMQINKGEFVAIVGQSGSGKSTCMNIIGCLDVPTAGTYKLNGRDMGRMSRDELAEIRNELLGFIFQQYNLLPKLSLMENVEVPLVYAGVPRGERHRRAAAALERVGLGDKLRNKPNQLSGGQQQRVSIARALAGRPAVILADEPTGALDSHTGREVLKMLQELHRQGNTVVLITHDNSIAVQAQRIIRLEDGRVVYDGDAHAPEAVVQPGCGTQGGTGGECIMIYETFREAVQNIWSNKFRTFLTMLGIIIGVTAVIVIVGLGNGMTQSIASSFADLGTNIISVQVMGYGSRSVEVEDVYSLVDAHPDLFEAVSPTASINGTVKVGTTSYSNTSIKGVSESYLGMSGYTVRVGRGINYVDLTDNKKICVVGDYISRVAYGGNAVGQTIKIGSEKYTIVGVLEAKMTDTSDQEGSSDDIVLLPYTTALRVSKTSTASSYAVTVTSEDNISEAKTVLENGLQELLNSDEGYMVTSMSEMLDMMTSMVNMVVTILTAIAAISLLVGGIGIMNIMMVSVTERTREIGIRKALGAKERVILGLFVTEAATTSALGGVLGIGLGYLLSALANSILPLVMSDMEMTVSPSLGSVAVAFGISVGIGVLFGYLPAKRAARLNPIEALRYD